jgi:hypothetical protein
MSERNERITSNIALMNSLESFDVVIVCCGKPTEAKYWQQRLSKGKGSILSASTLVLAVHEDWPGGAGNALGTLYAYQNASKLAKEEFNYDIDEKLKSGSISAALYHTAGKGTRMAPLPGAENNNKPGVKLPASINLEGKQVPITILEGVVKQTGCYAKSRKGRLSVFWGDQIFIPTVDVSYTPEYHADILCSLGPMMDEKEWADKGMDKYGLIALTESGKAAQVEKVTHSQAMDLLSHLDTIKSVGASLGSFSISSNMLFAFLIEFANDLSNKTGKLDSDPHLWMPLTLARESYIGVMGGKGVSVDVAGAHYDRMQNMMSLFHSNEENSKLGVFGPVDVGQGPCWWDYGQLPYYNKTLHLITENNNNEEANFMRSFFNVSNTNRKSDSIINDSDNLIIDNSSVISSCEINGNGNIKNSVLVNVHCHDIDVDNCILMNITANKITCKNNSICYNIATTDNINANEYEVFTGVTNNYSKQTIIRSRMDIDGGKSWDVKVEGNEYTFGEVHGNLNSTADPSELEIINSKIHNEAWEALNK